MNHDSQSAGGRAMPASPAQTDALVEDARSRLSFVVGSAIDIATIADACIEFTRMQAQDPSRFDLIAACVLLERMELLANCICSAVLEPETPLDAVVDKARPRPMDSRMVTGTGGDAFVAKFIAPAVPATPAEAAA